MNLLDTNIFLELLLDQKRADECERLLELDINRVEPDDLLRKPIGQHHELKH